MSLAGGVIRFTGMGDETFFMDGIENQQAVPWTNETEVANLQKIDIGVYPLPDEPWVMGKSGLKAIQYMALGIPTITTAIGANFRVIEHAKTSYLVKSDSEWLEHLKYLIESEQVRNSVGRDARMLVIEKFSIVANQVSYLKCVFDAMNKPSK